jgi:hypothetical protein
MPNATAQPYSPSELDGVRQAVALAYRPDEPLARMLATVDDHAAAVMDRWIEDALTEVMTVRVMLGLLGGDDSVGGMTVELAYAATAVLSDVWPAARGDATPRLAVALAAETLSALVAGIDDRAADGLAKLRGLAGEDS